MSSFYAVIRGKMPGIYNTWEDTLLHVKGFNKAKYKKCSSLEQAEQFVELEKLKEKNGILSPVLDILNQPSYQQIQSIEADIPKRIKPIITLKSHVLFNKNIFPDEIQLLISKYHKTYDGSNNLYIYTDGSTCGNGSKNASGGYGVFFSSRNMSYISERMLNCKITSGAAEVAAMVKALHYVVHNMELISSLTNGNIIIWYDSEYAAGVIQGSLQAHTNLELVTEARALLEQCRRSVTFKHVYSHTGKHDLHSIGNDIADKLAKKKYAVM